MVSAFAVTVPSPSELTHFHNLYHPPSILSPLITLQPSEQSVPRPVSREVWTTWDTFLQAGEQGSGVEGQGLNLVAVARMERE